MINEKSRRKYLGSYLVVISSHRYLLSVTEPKMRFIELLLGAAAITSVLAAPAADDASTSMAKQRRKSKFQFTGVNESGAEFGNKNLPGRLGKDYTWPVKPTIDVSDGHGSFSAGAQSI